MARIEDAFLSMREANGQQPIADENPYASPAPASEPLVAQATLSVWFVGSLVLAALMGAAIAGIRTDSWEINDAKGLLRSVNNLTYGALVGLGTVLLLRIVIWHLVSDAYAGAGKGIYGEHYMEIGLTIGVSLVGIVLWGSLAGSMLPIVLRRLKLDPASASAPFVATLVDVTGLVIYFSVASFFMAELLAA